MKGGDYREDTIVGAHAGSRAGEETCGSIPLTPGQSTTNIIRTLRGDSES